MNGRTNVCGKPEEEKTVTAGTSVIEVSPSSGKVMKKVTVNPTPTESKEVTAGTSDTTVSPTEGKYLSGVTVHPTPSQEKTVIPTADGFKVSPETGKLLSAVFVDGDSDLVAGNIKQGVNIFGVDGTFDNSHGAYVWKKLTSQGGDFLDFVVSDQETAYPDGGYKGGYWYEKVVEGFDLSRLGFSKYAVDTYVSSTRLSLKSRTVPHSLGEKPDFALIITSDGSQVTTVGDIYYASWRTIGDLSPFGITSLGDGLERRDSTATILQFGNDSGLASRYFVAGLEYTVITGKF